MSKKIFNCEDVHDFPVSRARRGGIDPDCLIYASITGDWSGFGPVRRCSVCKRPISHYNSGQCHVCGIFSTRNAIGVLDSEEIKKNETYVQEGIALYKTGNKAGNKGGNPA